MDLKAKIKAASLSILAIGLIVITIIVLGTADFNTPYDYNLVQLEEGWTISRDGISHPVETLSMSSIGMVNKGERIAISTVLPDDLDISQPAIQFRSILSTVEVYIEGELVYSYGFDFASAGKMIPKFYNFVPLPKQYGGKTLEIVFTPQEYNAFSSFSALLIGNYKDIANRLLQPQRLPITIGDFLCVFGFVLLVLSPFLIFNEYQDFSIMFSAITSVLLGIYILCFNDLFWYISNKPEMYTFWEYISLFLIPPSIIGFILSTGQIHNKKITQIIFFSDLLFVAIVCVLHFTDIIHICHFVTAFHALFLMEGLYIIFSLIYVAVKNRKEQKTLSAIMLIIGLLCFLFCALVDIVKFNILKYGSTGESHSTISFTTIGALLFMLFLFLNYFFHCIEYINQSIASTQLKGLAYSDTLTSLANRTRCELFLADLQGQYTIISLDLDYLKYTNDNYGHAEGDKLLSGFAAILKDSFTDASLLGRMGGDEFIVVLPFIDDERTERDINCMKDLMLYRTSKEEHIRYSASWGCANSDEKELSKETGAPAVYLLADKRMYSMKKNHHNESLGRLYDDLLKNMLTKGGVTNDE